MKKKELQKKIDEWVVYYSQLPDKRTKDAKETKQLIQKLYKELIVL